MIKLTFEFQTVEEAVRFLHRNDATIAAAVAHDTPAPKPKATRRTTPPATAPVENAAPQYGVVQSAQPNTPPPGIPGMMPMPKIAPNAAPKEFVAQLHVDKEGHIQAELVKPAPSSHGVVQSSQPNAAPPRVLTPEETTGHVPTIPPPVKAVEKKPNTPVQAVAVTVAEVNEAAVRAALREVVNTKSMKAAAEILKGFGATSISQIKPEQYAEFIKACKL